ncbi:MAG: ATP synthase F1 subunit epsilon [Bacillus subtilis]|nr:ATP synthase F1 subunit epsilon [Bacillus subtilis]
MRISIVTPDGELYNEMVNAVIVASDNNGDYEILPGHLPIVSTIHMGYVKLFQGEYSVFVVIVNGIVEQHKDEITVIAQDAYIGKTKEEAMANLTQIRAARIEDNKTRNIELALAEQELKKQIKLTGAGEL